MKTTENKKTHIPDYEVLFQEADAKAEEREKKKRYSAVPKTLLKQNLGNLLLSEVLYFFKASAEWVIPIITAEIINVVTYQDPHMVQKLIIYAIILAFLFIQNLPTHVLYSRFVDKKLRTISAGLRNTFIRKLQHLSINYHKEIETGKIQSKFMRDIESIEQLCTHTTKFFMPAIFNVLIYISIVAMRSGIMTIFFLIVIPVNIIIIQFFKKVMGRTNRDFRIENENVSAKVSGMLDMLQVTKAHGLENQEIADIEQRLEILTSKGLAVDKVNAYFGSISWIATQFMNGICLFFCTYLAIKGKIQVGDIVLYQNYFHSISNQVNSLINMSPTLIKGLDSLSSLSEIILSDDIEDNSGKIKLRYVHGRVNFRDVSFKYPNSTENVIKDFNLDVEPGECIALVGASGSGKSTIMNMIIGFLKATNGTVLIDGKPIDALNLTDYRHFISVVPQNCILFTGSIKDNITYGLTNVSKEQLDEVIRLSNIDEFAKDLPQGLDTPVGENGTKLSGGQKQRISIARALIRDPKILILDEATSALDNISEYHVQKAINQLAKGRTTFIVAHRLSTIRHADRIVVMENGRCVETGTYDELIDKKGKFFELKTLTDRVVDAE